MKEYPSIGGPHYAEDEDCYGFVKYDGSCIRCEWSKKRGWYKFGTRTRMLDPNDKIFGSAIPLFLNKYGEDLIKVFRNQKKLQGTESAVVFCEWFGPQSFSGNHKPWDEKDIVLFDVNIHKKGILSPRDFLDFFGHLKVAEVVYQGRVTPEFIESVRKETLDLESKYPIKAEIPEGVVCKGGSGHRLWMCKIKTERYKAALQTLYESDWQKYWD
jgi:hypothetical protein